MCSYYKAYMAPLRPLNSTYTLPSGKELTREVALEIGLNAGLDTSWRDEASRESEVITIIEDGKMVDRYLTEKNPIYRPYILDVASRPPMLLFISSSRNDASGNPTQKSAYTINLKTLSPTGPSRIQTSVPMAIRSALK